MLGVQLSDIKLPGTVHLAHPWSIGAVGQDLTIHQRFALILQVCTMHPSICLRISSNKKLYS